MNIYKILILTILIIAANCFQACDTEEFLELERPPEAPYKTPLELEFGVASTYNRIFSDNWANPFAGDRTLWSITTDLVYQIPGANAQYPITEYYLRQTNLNTGRIDKAWEHCYKLIGTANDMLTFIEENENNPFDTNEPNELDNIERIRGELHFMRAYAYFKIIFKHGYHPDHPNFASEEVVPLRTSIPESKEDATNPPYATTEAVYEQIKSDIAEAVNLLPIEYQSGTHHSSYRIGRAKRHAAHALAYKVYFLLGEMDTALEHLNVIIDSGMYPLDTEKDPIEIFNKENDAKHEGVIWTHIGWGVNQNFSTLKDFTLLTKNPYWAMNGGRPINDDGEGHERVAWHTFTTSKSMLLKLGWIDEEYNETDVAQKDKRYQQLFYRYEASRGLAKEPKPHIYDAQLGSETPLVFCDKYYRSPDGQFANTPVYRIAEMYLARAVIRLKNGDASGAADDLNLIRKRAWDEEVAGEAYETSDQFVTDGNITEDMILTEFIKEMGYEGGYLHWLMSLERPVPPGDRVGVSPVAHPYEGLRWRIPESEIDFRDVQEGG